MSEPETVTTVTLHAHKLALHTLSRHLLHVPLPARHAIFLKDMCLASKHEA